MGVDWDCVGQIGPWCDDMLDREPLPVINRDRQKEETREEESEESNESCGWGGLHDW